MVAKKLPWIRLNCYVLIMAVLVYFGILSKLSQKCPPLCCTTFNTILRYPISSIENVVSRARAAKQTLHISFFEDIISYPLSYGGKKVILYPITYHGRKKEKDCFVLFCLWEIAWYEATAKEYPIISEVYPNLQE
jgi:hypothetical protein